MMADAFTKEQKGKNVFAVTMDGGGTGWERWFLLRSDAHHDNPDCDQALEKRHLDMAMERDAGIIDGGDLFCAMQGKYDKRSNKSKLRPEHQHGSYLDKLVSTAADFYQPYAANWITLGTGNHETGILKNHETDLTERLAATITDRTGHQVYHGHYRCWIRFHLRNGTTMKSFTMTVGHGYGGGGPVTKDIIQTNRQAAYMSDVDIVMSGHTHDAWIYPLTRVKLNRHYNLEHRTQYHIKVPGYKDEYKDGSAGWAVEKGHPPKPKGCVWLRFYGEGKDWRVQPVLDI